MSSAPTLIITFDDGWASMTTAAAYLESKGVRGTFYIAHDLMDTTGKLTTAEVITLAEAGHCIGNHSYPHSSLNGYASSAPVLALLDPNKAYLAMMGGSGQHVAYPFGDHDANALTAMEDGGYITGRTTTAGLTDEPPADLHDLPCYMIADSTTLAVAKGYIDAAIAAEKTVIVGFHDIVETPDSQWEWSIADFEDFVDYAVAAEIDVLTMSEWYGDDALPESTVAGLTKTASGLVHFDDFRTDTSADYDESAGTLSVADGVMSLSSAGSFTYPTTGGVKCATVIGYIPSSGDSTNGPIISANSSMDDSGNRDYYRFEYSATQWLLRRYIDSSASTLASAATPDPGGAGYWSQRLYISSGTVYAKFGEGGMGDWDYSNTLSAADETYASGYGGGIGGAGVRKWDIIDLRTAHTVTCTGLPSGAYLRVSDGVSAAEAQESSGTAVVDASTINFPLSYVKVYSASGGGGTLLASLLFNDDQTMGGGDTYAYSSPARPYYYFAQL